MKAVLLVSHGSHSPKTKHEVASLVKQLKRRSKIKIFKFAFLEIEQPSIPSGIEMCVQAGVTQVLILLNLLNSGKHVDEDIPRIVNEARKKYPKVNFKITPPVGQHAKIVDLFLDFIERE